QQGYTSGLMANERRSTGSPGAPPHPAGEAIASRFSGRLAVGKPRAGTDFSGLPGQSPGTEKPPLAYHLFIPRGRLHTRTGGHHRRDRRLPRSLLRLPGEETPTDSGRRDSRAVPAPPSLPGTPTAAQHIYSGGSVATRPAGRRSRLGGDYRGRPLVWRRLE